MDFIAQSDDSSLPTLELCLGEVLPGLSKRALLAILAARSVEVNKQVRLNESEEIVPGSDVRLCLPAVDGGPIRP